VKQASQIYLKKLFHRIGLDVRKKSGAGYVPFVDVARLAGPMPTIFDVGANVGQSVEEFQKYTKQPVIHAFEPGEAAFRQLQNNHGTSPNVRLNNFALGSKSGQLELIENDYSTLSSFLEPGRDALGDVGNRRSVFVQTVDEYTREHAISSIDVLKIDTQGFDLEVLKGAQRMLLAHRIKLLVVELTFVQMYRDAPRIDEVLRFIYENGFETVALYNVFYRNDRAGEVDGLFIQPEYRK
jgi:FkbM family methyltransferase